jgi:UDP-GlcNAc:undecaprenyl-phosphate GlcNAc-1-phosphate transferase
MYTLLILAIMSFSVAFILTPLCRDLAIRWGLVDQPDNIRKFHPRSIPHVGGIAMFIAYVISFAVFLPSSQLGDMVRSYFGVVRNLFPAATIVFITGLLDDLLRLKAWQKFVGQFVAAAIAVWAGVQIPVIVWHQIPSWCAIPVTLLWLVGCTNAFNLIDGVDGLAAGVGLLATLTILIASLLDHNIGLAIAVVPLTGALLGVLCFNFNPASVFLGDSGSLLIGFLLGCYSVLWSQKSATALAMTAPIIALSIPLLDTGLAIIRRFLRHQPIFGADHGHIHHKLLARGLTPRRVVILIYLACGFCAFLSLLLSFAHERFGGAVIVLVCAGAWFGIQHLGYAEFEMARRLVLAGNFRRQLNAELQLSTFRDNLAAAATAEQCWKVLQNAYSEFGFNEIRFKLGRRIYTHTTNGHHIANTWTVRIPLSESDYVNLSREFDTECPPIVARFTDAIGKALLTKTSGMLRAGPIQPDVAISGRQVQAAERASQALAPITAIIRNR